MSGCGGCSARNRNIARRSYGDADQAVSVMGPDGECLQDGVGNCRVWLDRAAAVAAARQAYGSSGWEIVPATVTV